MNANSSMGKLHDESNEINFPRLFSFTFDRKNVKLVFASKIFPSRAPAIACNRGEYREVRESRRVKSRFALPRSRDT